MPLQPSNDHLKPRSITIPVLTTTQKELLIVEVGTLVMDTTLGKLSFCITARTTGGAAWEDVTSA